MSFRYVFDFFLLWRSVHGWHRVPNHRQHGRFYNSLFRLKSKPCISDYLRWTVDSLHKGPDVETQSMSWGLRRRCTIIFMRNTQNTWGGVVGEEVNTPERIMNSNLAKSHFDRTFFFIIKPFWNVILGTAMILSCSEHNSKMTSILEIAILLDLG